MRVIIGVSAAALLALSSVGCASAGDQASGDASGAQQQELHELGQGLQQLAGQKLTKLASGEEFSAARQQAYREYKLDKSKGKALRSSLGTLGNLVRADDALLLAKLGRVYVGDDLVFSPELLVDKAQAQLVASEVEDTRPEQPEAGAENVGQVAQALTGRSWQAEDRQYPYKMIGKSYHDTSTVYGEVGASTDFQKHREKYWGLGKRWYALDAEHLSVRSVVFKNNVAVGVEQDSDSNDDNVWVTADWCASSSVFGSPSCHDILSPYGLHSFHAVDHGSYRFRVETANNVADGANYNGYSAGYNIPW